jgi:hypothetical protein
VHTRTTGSDLSEPVILNDLRSIVVYDDFNNPILVVQKLDKGSIYTCSAGEPDFVNVLKGLGIGLNARCITHTRSQS